MPEQGNRVLMSLCWGYVISNQHCFVQIRRKNIGLFLRVGRLPKHTIYLFRPSHFLFLFRTTVLDGINGKNLFEILRNKR